MIGLEYIAKEFHMRLTDIANILGVTRKSISNWTKGWQTIPKKHLGKLSLYFGVPEHYFQKELNDIEKLEVHVAKLTKEDIRRQQIGEEHQNEAIVRMLSNEIDIEELSISLRNEISSSDDKLDVIRRVVHILQEKNDIRFEALYMFLMCMGDFMGGKPFTVFKNEELGKELFLLLKKHEIVYGDLD
ncbi:helix-turn-helix transcriptional regulator [Psychrobacillus sp. FSL K6-2684]|uniref:helix-turn-helix domain-containing protein n=1 Tax=Psychrobacillus sp. FSL K6-2684 TaxID=2921547 RepID=UPI0030F4D93A